MSDTYMDRLIKEANVLAETLLRQMDELAQLLTQEKALVYANQAEALAALLRRKNGMIGDYQLTLKNLTSRPELMQALPEKMRLRLRKAGEQLDQVVTDNALMLKGAVQGTARMVQNIFSLIRAEALPRHGYNNLQPGPGVTEHYSPTAPAVIINRTA